MTNENTQPTTASVSPEAGATTRGKSAIIYSQTKPSPDHQKITMGQGTHALYVRVEVVEGDALHALDVANPREDETVLNTVDLPLNEF
jgi:hypothetical protein